MHLEFHATTQPASPAGLPTGAEAKDHKDHFLKLMWFQPSGVAALPTKRETPPQASRQFRALPQSKLRPNASYHLPDEAVTRIRAESPAIEVMTDLRRTAAITIVPFAFIEDANQTMIVNRVRALFVGDDHRLLCIVTAADILGQKPIQLTQQRGIRHAEVLVRDIMTPAELIEVIDMTALRRAKVGDVVETLKRAGRQHALVVDEAAESQQTIVGIFSLTQIARQLGITLSAPDFVRTLTEIEAAMTW